MAIYNLPEANPNAFMDNVEKYGTYDPSPGPLEKLGNWIGDTFFGGSHHTNEVNQSIAEQNIAFQRETNEKNEALLRESWAREDNAVQRRVADLKAAGLSPTLAAGSAAAASGPISLKSPENSFQYQNPFGPGLISYLGAIQDLKHKKLENEYLKKEVDNYGAPKWLKGLESIIDKLFGKGEGGTVLSAAGEGLKNAMSNLKEFFSRIDYKPSYGLTFGTPPKGTAASTAIGRSAAAHGATFDETTMSLTFKNASQARDWYLSIGGTTAEWNYGLAVYKKPVDFIKHIIEDGYITVEGDAFFDR